MSKVIVIGQMDNSDGTHEQANRIYGADGIAPCVSTFCGGGQEAKVLEVIYEDKGKQYNRVL